MSWTYELKVSQMGWNEDTEEHGDFKGCVILKDQYGERSLSAQAFSKYGVLEKLVKAIREEDNRTLMLGS